MSEKPQRTESQEGVRTHAFLIYDGESGEVVHGHKEVFLPDAEVPDHKQMAEQALGVAAEATGRTDGLRALAGAAEEHEPGVAYRVDPKSERLEPLGDAAA